MSNVGNLLQKLGETASATFASFVYTAKGSGEVAKYRLILGADTTTLYKKDVEQLESLIVMMEGMEADPIKVQAAQEILASRRESLVVGVGNNSAYTNADTYHYLPGFKGVRIHKDSGALYVTGLQEGKETIVPGVHKKVNSRPLTIAKREIERGLPSGRFRMFKLENVETAALHGDTLVLTTP